MLVVLENQCGPSHHLPRFSTISWGGPSCTSLVICCSPSRHFPGLSTINWGEDLVQALWFCWSVFFACVLVEVQFLGYKFGLKGSSYTRENMVYEPWLVENKICPKEFSPLWPYMYDHHVRNASDRPWSLLWEYWNACLVTKQSQNSPLQKKWK